MKSYEQKIQYELVGWKQKINKRSNFLQRLSKKAQNKVNLMIPEKVHQVVTEAIKKLVQATLFGSEYTTLSKDVGSFTLEEREQQVRNKLDLYKRTAAVEGAGTGAGGFLLGLADFPLLLSIKMKFLFEVASIYGFNIKQYEERLFILYVFQLAFSSDEHRRDVLQIIEQWEQRNKELQTVDWQKLQQEYRDYIDFVKLLQLVPGIGAVVGAYANINLLDQLGETAMNAYRLRLLSNNGTV
jgi:hypothetical protein